MKGQGQMVGALTFALSRRRDGRFEANLETGNPPVLGARWLRCGAPSRLQRSVCDPFARNCTIKRYKG